MINPCEYYRDIRIIHRMLEYCGAEADDLVLEEKLPGLVHSKSLAKSTCDMTAEYLVGWGKKLLDERGREFESVFNYSMGWLLDNGFDVFRSVWDRKNMLFVIDIEYYSKKYPQTPYIDQDYTFHRLEPFYWLIREVLSEYKIDPFVLVTGQGYHFVFQVAEKTKAYKKMIEIGAVEDTLLGKYQHLSPETKRARKISEDEGKAYDAVGKLLEFIYHKVIEKMREKDIRFPLLVGDVAIGNERMEAVSFDLSGYANPIHMRDIRLAFSTHQKHKVHAYKVGHYVSSVIPIQLAVPRYIPGQLDIELDEVFNNRRHYSNTARLASGIKCTIPNQEKGVEKLIKDYKSSKLYKFHKDFDMVQQNPFYDWHKSYDMFDLSRVPPCVSHALAHPNPHLLQPTQLQTIVRALAGKQWWHPKHIAGLIRSKYERDYGWEVDFLKYDANAWANIWTRIYAGLLVDGTDNLSDFNCISHQEKGISWAGKPYCVVPNCGYSLGNYR